MCGRIVQKSGPMDYVERIFPNQHQIFTDSAGPRYNVPPGTRPHRLPLCAREAGGARCFFRQARFFSFFFLRNRV